MGRHSRCFLSFHRSCFVSFPSLFRHFHTLHFFHSLKHSLTHCFFSLNHSYRPHFISYILPHSIVDCISIPSLCNFSPRHYFLPRSIIPTISHYITTTSSLSPAEPLPKITSSLPPILQISIIHSLLFTLPKHSLPHSLHYFPSPHSRHTHTAVPPRTPSPSLSLSSLTLSLPHSSFLSFTLGA